MGQTCQTQHEAVLSQPVERVAVKSSSASSSGAVVGAPIEKGSPAAASGGKDALLRELGGLVQAMHWTEENTDAESLDWLNALTAKLWPSFTKAFEEDFLAHGAQDIMEQLPYWLQGYVTIDHVFLGDAAPQLTNVRRQEAETGVRFDIRFDYSADINISLSLNSYLPFGLSHLTLGGDLTIELGPFIDRMPVLSKVSFFFMDPPTVIYGFSGALRVAEIPGLKHALRHTIDGAIADAVVMPNVLAVGLPGGEGPSMKTLMPLGVLRVEPQRATDVKGADWHAWGGATSDVYLRMRFADQRWVSSVVKATCNPEWPLEEMHDFLVHNMEQKLCVEVLDEDWTNEADHLGSIAPVRIQDVVDVEHKDLPIYEQAILLDAGSRVNSGAGRGVLRLGFSWLHISDRTPAQLGTVDNFEYSSALIAMEITKVFLPAELANAGIKLRMTVGASVQTTWFHSTNEKTHEMAVAAVDQTVVDVIRRGASCRLPVHTLAEMTGVSPQAVSRILADTKTAPTRLYAEVTSVSTETTEVSLDIRNRLCTPLLAHHLPSTIVKLDVINRAREEIGKSSLALVDVGLQWPSPQMPSLLVFQDTAGKTRITAEVNMRVYGLEPGYQPAGQVALGGG